MDKRGAILVETIVFLVLNLLFLSILTTFIIQQGSGAVTYEDFYAKEIALLTDSARDQMQIKVDMRGALELCEKNDLDFNEIIQIKDNYVRIKLTEKGGKMYHYFSDYDVAYYPDKNANYEYNGMYVLTFSKR